MRSFGDEAADLRVDVAVERAPDITELSHTGGDAVNEDTWVHVHSKEHLQLTPGARR